SLRRQHMLLDDNPSVEDYFNFKNYVDILTRIIIDIESAPFTIGIFGPWGSGKTTLMKQIHDELKNKCKTIWFNPWKYDNKEAVWNAFIQSILEQMKKDLEFQADNKSKDLIDKIVKCGKKLAWYTFKIGANKLTSGVFSDDFLESLKNSFDTNEEAYEFINKFEYVFSELITEYCGGKKLVIFIDDLDRCIPENAITILESIKLYMGESNTVFVLGLEKEIVEKGIHFRYKSEIDFSGKDYLEKIIQLPFMIPSVKNDDIMNYIFKHQNLQILPSSHENEFVKLVLSGTDGNIRKVKRFLNCFYVLKVLSKISPDDYDRHKIFVEILNYCPTLLRRSTKANTLICLYFAGMMRSNNHSTTF
ncbi:MAG: P-loop NTPase fold protein, partial [Deltaproteobacteria bacterium]